MMDQLMEEMFKICLVLIFLSLSKLNLNKKDLNVKL
jgi:hypothetical protein